MWEIFTYGGGIYLVNIFNAVAALVYGNDYASLIKISLLFALIWVLLRLSFTQQYNIGAKWFFTYLIIYNGLFLPKVTVHITDRLNPSLSAATIANVPFALAAFASITSKIGDGVTMLMEQNFTLPDDLQYQKNGMLMGVELLRQINNVKIANNIFASNLENFIEQCVFYDLLLNKYSLDELQHASNIWEFVTITNPASPARSLLYQNIDNPQIRNIVTCQEAVSLFNSSWSLQETNAIKKLAINLLPQRNPINANNIILAMLPITQDYFMQISDSSLKFIQQNLLINAFENSAGVFSAKNIADAYANAKSDIQTKLAYNNIARQAAKWVPLLKIVFEAIYYGAFPLVFLLFMLPIAEQIFKAYFFAFIWLQSWPALYSILHMIISNKMRQDLLAANLLPDGSHGVTIFNYAAINNINNDVADMAGYLSMSIPFIALSIVKGVGAIAGLASSMLAIPQKSASEVAHELASGNINLGNSSIANHNANNINSNKYNNSYYQDSGAIQMRNEQGGFSSIYNNGYKVFDQSQSTTNMPALSLNLAQTIASESQHRISQLNHQASEQANAAHNSLALAYSQAMNFATNKLYGRNNSTDYDQRLSAEENNSISQVASLVKTYSKSHNVSQTQAINALAGISAGIGAGLAGSALDAKINASYNYNKSASDSDNLTMRLDDSGDIRKALNNIISLSKKEGYAMLDQEQHNLSDSINNNLTKAQHYDQLSRQSQSKAQDISSSMANLRTNNFTHNTNLINDFTSWLLTRANPNHPDRLLQPQDITSLATLDSPYKRNFLNQMIAEYSQKIISNIENNQNISKDIAISKNNLDNQQNSLSLLQQQFNANNNKLLDDFESNHEIINNSFMSNR